MLQYGRSPSFASPAENVTACSSEMPTSNVRSGNRSIMNEVRYVVNKNTGAEVRAVDVFVDSMIL